MTWWDTVTSKVTVGLELYTPGRGDRGRGGKPFRVISVDSKRISILSGKSSVPLLRDCFEALEKDFVAHPHLWLRVASSHGAKPFEGSADAVIRKHTGSQLARGNYVCSILVRCDLVVYVMHENQKGIQLASSRELARIEHVSTGPTSMDTPFTPGIDARISKLIEGFQDFLNYFSTNLKFSGPSLYFHTRTIRMVRKEPYEDLFSDTRFCEYVYATLASWGMHRMGKGGAKMASFEEFKDSIENVKELCLAVRNHQLEKLSDSDADIVKSYLGQVFDRLVVMKSATRLVGNSKAMHHLLPDLVPPIDREHTLQFLFGNKNMAASNEKILFELCFDRFRDIAAAVGDKHVVFEGFNTSLPKIIDNAIMGYVMVNS